LGYEVKQAGITVFTVTNDPETTGAKLLQNTAEAWGWPLEWYIQKEGWDKTFRAQQLGQLAVLTAHPENQYFLYTDAWDTLFVGPMPELYDKLQPGVVTFSGDTVLHEAWQNYQFKARLTPEAFPPVGYGQFPFVNDGVIWGDSRLMIRLCEDYLNNYRPEIINQDYFNVKVAAELALFNGRLRIDSKAEVVLDLMGTQNRHVVDLPGHRVKYVPTGSLPIVLHFPGLGIEASKVMPRFLWDFHQLATESVSEGS